MYVDLLQLVVCFLWFSHGGVEGIKYLLVKDVPFCLGHIASATKYILCGQDRRRGVSLKISWLNQFGQWVAI